MADRSRIPWSWPTSGLGIEIGPDKLRAFRPGRAGEAEAMEVEWGRPPPPESVEALRERFGSGNVLAVALDMSVVYAKRLELPPLPPEERRRILSMDPRRYFPVRDQAMVAGVREDDLVVAVPGETFDQWIGALGAVGLVERVEPSPAALARHLAACGVTHGLLVLEDSGGGGTTLAEIVEGRLEDLRKVVLGPGELPQRVSPLLDEAGVCTLDPWREEVAEAVRKHLGGGGSVAPTPPPPGAPTPFAAARGALLGMDAGPALTLVSEALGRRLTAARRRRAVLAISGLVAAFLLLGWAVDHRRATKLEALEREVAAAELAAAPVLELRERAARLARELDGVATAAQDRSDPLEVLLTLTRILPADTYLTRLSASGEEWELNGRALDAARLIALLEDSNLLTDVRFRTATTRVRTGDGEVERFTLVFRHVPTT